MTNPLDDLAGELHSRAKLAMSRDARVIREVPEGVERDEAKASAILSELQRAKDDLVKSGKATGNAWNGMDARFRNRLLREAGYSYNDAYFAVAKVLRGS